MKWTIKTKELSNLSIVNSWMSTYKKSKLF